jgi:hypothetical protein
MCDATRAKLISLLSVRRLQMPWEEGHRQVAVQQYRRATAGVVRSGWTRRRRHEIYVQFLRIARE